MELQCSMSGALAEMGFVTAKGKRTAQQQFEKSVRHELQDFAEERGIKIDRSPGEKHSHFVGNVKKIVTAITTELNWYKAVFKDIWNKTSKDIRHLADLMDRNNCEKFSDYNRKFYNGELDYQIQEKKRIKQQHTLRQKKINDDYEWDR